MKNIEHPPQTARKKAERKWANNDLRRRYKEAKQANVRQLEPPKTTVVTVVNPFLDEQRELNELVESNRKKFVSQMKKLVKEGREQGIKRYELSIEQQKRRLLVAKYKILLARQEVREQARKEPRERDLFA
jgi:hypothetical protein